MFPTHNGQQSWKLPNAPHNLRTNTMHLNMGKNHATWQNDRNMLINDYIS